MRQSIVHVIDDGKRCSSELCRNFQYSLVQSYHIRSILHYVYVFVRNTSTRALSLFKPNLRYLNADFTLQVHIHLYYSM